MSVHTRRGLQRLGTIMIAILCSEGSLMFECAPLVLKGPVVDWTFVQCPKGHRECRTATTFAQSELTIRWFPFRFELSNRDGLNVAVASQLEIHCVGEMMNYNLNSCCRCHSEAQLIGLRIGVRHNSLRNFDAVSAVTYDGMSRDRRDSESVRVRKQWQCRNIHNDDWDCLFQSTINDLQMHIITKNSHEIHSRIPSLSHNHRRADESNVNFGPSFERTRPRVHKVRPAIFNRPMDSIADDMIRTSDCNCNWNCNRQTERLICF
jgi:hypothetical protein